VCWLISSYVLCREFKPISLKSATVVCYNIITLTYSRLLCYASSRSATILRERKCADTIGTVLVLWTGHFQCRNINIFFSKKLYESNFVKQHSETVMVWNCQNAEKWTCCVIYYNFRHTFVPYASANGRLIVFSDPEGMYEVYRHSLGLARNGVPAGYQCTLLHATESD